MMLRVTRFILVIDTERCGDSVERVGRQFVEYGGDRGWAVGDGLDHRVICRSYPNSNMPNFYFVGMGLRRHLPPRLSEALLPPISTAVPPPTFKGLELRFQALFYIFFSRSGYLGKDSYTEGFVDDLGLKWLE